MQIALCGLPRAGKTTLWTILTGATAPAGAKPEARTAVARVPDPRLDRLSAHYRPRKHTPAAVTYVDVAPVARGESRADSPMAVALRPADALVAVLRAWDDEADPHPEGSVDPARDLALIETELLLADLEVAERRIERLDALIRKSRRGEDVRERELMVRAAEALAAEQPLRELGLDEAERTLVRGFAFLTAKPLLVAVNLGEDRAAELSQPAAHFGLARVNGTPHRRFVAFSARIEQELSELQPADAAAFRAELGIAEPALDRLLRASFELLGQVSFFTVGEDECRAWPVRTGSSARAAAGTIHSDLARGFIRAEVVPWNRLLEAGSLAKARERGWLRLEGKDYIVQDGDVLHVRHAT